jgi:hypothetical protein
MRAGKARRLSNLVMGELSFSYAQSFEKIWPTGQEELGRVIRVYDKSGQHD